MAVPLNRGARISVELKLPGITIGTDDIGALFKRGVDAGPFLVASRVCGLALDTGFTTDNGAGPILWPIHARRHQLWFLRPTGHAGETLIVSADTGLALDATQEAEAGRVLLWEANGAPWQRWSLQPSPDKAGYLLASVVDGRVLVANDNAERGWKPWLSDRDGGWEQQWVLALPHGGTAR